MKDNKQYIWRTTLNPVYSERKLEEYYREISKTINEVNRSYGMIGQNIYDSAKKHCADGGTEDTFELNNDHLKMIFARACFDKYGEEQRQFMNEMIEANIAVLNGTKISDKKEVDWKEPSKHSWTDFDPANFDEKKIDYKLLQKYKSGVEGFRSNLKRDWDYQVKNGWLYRHFLTDPKDEEWTDEGWRKLNDKDSEIEKNVESFFNKVQLVLIGGLVIAGFFVGSWFGVFIGFVSGLLIVNIQNIGRDKI